MFTWPDIKTFLRQIEKAKQEFDLKHKQFKQNHYWTDSDMV